MVIQFGVKEHIKMAETYRWAEEELVKYLRIQNELIDDSKRYWNGETAESFRQDYEYMLQEGEYAAFLKHVRGMKEVMEESIPRLRRLQQMVVELPTAYGLPCDEEAPETLRLDEEAVARYHELSDELIERKYHFYEEMTSVMDGCEGLVDFSEDRRELEKLLDEIQQMKTYKRMLDEYADEMRRMDNWMVERLSEYVKIGDGNSKSDITIQKNNYPENNYPERMPSRKEIVHIFDKAKGKLSNLSSAEIEKAQCVLKMLVSGFGKEGEDDKYTKKDIKELCELFKENIIVWNTIFGEILAPCANLLSLCTSSEYLLRMYILIHASRTRTEESDYVGVYYLNKEEGAMGQGHAALMFVREDGTGVFYSYAGYDQIEYSALMMLNYNIPGYMSRTELTADEVSQFFTGQELTDNHNMEFDILYRGVINTDFFDVEIYDGMRNNKDHPYNRTIYIPINDEQGDLMVAQAEEMRQDTPDYNLYSNNCGMVAQWS